jgi:hypothetical protein
MTARLVIPLSEDRPRLHAALTTARGSITRAAEVLGVSKHYLLKVVKKHELNAWARELRVRSGLPVTGRPPASARL